MSTALKQAVVVIDVQRVFEAGAHRAHAVESVIDRLNSTTGRARRLGVPVVMVQHAALSGPLARGEEGWHFASALHVEPDDIVVHKTTADAFHLTRLDEVIKSMGISEIVVGGMQTDFCVDTTVRRALALGYEVRLIADGHTTLGNGVLTAEQIVAHHNLTLSGIASFGPRVRLVPAAALRLS